jgi:hypothetical protein
MRTIKFFAIATFLSIVTNAFAQSATSSSPSTSATSDNWHRVWIEYDPSKFKDTENDDNDISFTGFACGYSRSFRLSQNTPLFIEGGFGIQYSFFTKDYTSHVAEKAGVSTSVVSSLMDPKAKFHMFSAKVPINIMYAYHLPNDAIEIIPFAGITARYNISGEMELKYNFTSLASSYGLDPKDFPDRDIDIFDSKDTGNSTFERLQIGWQIGVNARFSKKYMVGLSYGNDFSEISHDTKVQTISISLSCCF